MEKRAITPTEKKLILARLYRVWMQNPDQRLGQMLFNVFGTTTTVDGKPMEFIHEMNTFNIEDFPFIERVEKMMLKKKVIN